MLTEGGGSGLKFFKIILFQKIVFATKTILFHFRHGSMLK